MSITTATTNLPIADNAGVRRYKQVKLMQRTAWRLSQPTDVIPMPDEEEKKEIYAGCTMVTLLASLDLFIYDLIEALEAENKYRFAIKRNVNKARDLILNAHTIFYKRIWSVYRDYSDYNKRMDDYYRAIDECIELRDEPVARAYSIVVAMCRLQAKYRKMMVSHTYHPSIEVEKIPSMLECIGARDYVLDNIIENRIKTILKN